jgi:hypothetical protein
VEGELLDAALAALGETVRAACDAAPPPADDALRAALEALCNVFVAGADGGEEEGEEVVAAAEEDEDPCAALRARAAERLPGTTLLPQLFGALSRHLAPPAPAAAPDGGGSSSAATPDYAETGVPGRLMRTTGSLLSSASQSAVVAAAAEAWPAALRAASHLATLDEPRQCELLDLLNLLVSASSSFGDGDEAECAGTREPARGPSLALVHPFAREAKAWPQAASGAARASAVSLVGQLLGMLRRAAAAEPGAESGTSSASSLLAMLGSELVGWLHSDEPLAAAEAAAALAEDTDALKQEAGPVPVTALVSAAVLRESLGALLVRLGPLAARGDEKAAAALELVEAAQRAVAVEAD